jgi:hypothetical protein
MLVPRDDFMARVRRQHRERVKEPRRSWSDSVAAGHDRLGLPAVHPDGPFDFAISKHGGAIGGDVQSLAAAKDPRPKLELGRIEGTQRRRSGDARIQSRVTFTSRRVAPRTSFGFPLCEYGQGSFEHVP